MVICKFYQQGNCKFGSRCYNEHVRYNENRSRGQQRSQNDNYGNRGRNQNYVQPSRFDDSNRQHKSHTTDNYSSPFNRGGSNNTNFSSGSEKHHTQQSIDKFHWTSKSQSNRFNALAELEEPPLSSNTVQSEDHASMFKTISEDMALWPSSKMWPFSCYSYAKEKNCVEGLADIQPEEIRTLYYLYGLERYRNILDEVELIYTKRKEELRYMSEETKSSLLLQLGSSIESNPSAGLSIYSLYGPGTEFKSSSKVADVAAFPTQSTVNPTVTSTTTDLFKPAVAQSNPSALPPPSSSFIQPPPATGGALGQMFKTVPAAETKPLVSVSLTTQDPTYTDKTELTATELQQFEAQSFTLGKIPMRPPPKDLCR
nr:nucleoporin-like protein 2 [Ciona intestinalis]|eukprot:XP_002130948.1 nucleoporin-like protein 2 [Ciona intestinalis]